MVFSATEYTNEQLVELIKGGGDTQEYLAQLWGQVRKIIALLAAKHYMTAQRLYSSYVDNDDFVQCGYFAMLEAIEAFDASKGFMFVSYLKYRYTDCVNKMLGIKRIKSERGRIWKLPDTHVSLDKPLMTDSDESRGDFIADESGDIYRQIEIKELSVLMAAAIDELQPRQQTIIRGIYFQGKTTAQLANELNASCPQYIGRASRKALAQMQKNKALRKYYYSNYEVPAMPSYTAAPLDNIVVAYEDWGNWKNKYKRELEALQSGF